MPIGIDNLCQKIQGNLQPIAQKQQSYLTTDFINYLEKIKVPQERNTCFNGLYQPLFKQEEGIETVCRAYNMFYNTLWQAADMRSPVAVAI